jgi:hypothetical protein
MNRALLCALLFAVVLALGGCSDDDSTPPPQDTLPPTVTQAEPVEGTTNLGLLQPIRITFSEAMDPATVNPRTVELGSPAIPLVLSLSPGGTSLVILPDSLYPSESALTLTLGSAKDLAGNGLVPYTLNLGTGPLDCEHLADRFEPNGETLTATPVRVDSTYVGLSTCLADIDFYSCTIQDTMMITAKTIIEYANSDSWGIFWIRNDGRQYATLGTTATTGSTPSFRHTFLPGTYYLMVFGTYSEERVVYDLLLESGAPCRDDAFEDNDFEDEAASIEPGSHPGLTGCYLDADWFSLPILAGQTLTLTMDTHEYRSIRRLTIQVDPYSNSETFHDETVSSISLTATEDGTALLMCMVWEDGVVYDMTIEVTN